MISRIMSGDLKACRGFRAHPGATLLVMMCVGLGTAAVMLRMPIRVRWWEYRLRSASTETHQLYYFNLLAASGQSALPAARALLCSEDGTVRLLGARLLSALEGADAAALRRAAVQDLDQAGRNVIILGMARYADPGALHHVATMRQGPDPASASLAVAAYGYYDCAVATAPLSELARAHPSPYVRALAIEQLSRLKCADAIPVLIKALEDLSVYEGQTPLQRLDEIAAREFGDLRPELRDEANEISRLETVADQAALALRMMTGQSFGFRSADDAPRRRAAQTAWLNWWRQHLLG